MGTEASRLDYLPSQMLVLGSTTICLSLVTCLHWLFLRRCESECDRNLNRFDTRVFARDRGFDESSVSEDKESRTAHEPEHEAKGACKPQQGDAEDKQTSV